MPYGCKWTFIATYVIDSEEAYEYGSIDNYGAALDEEGGGGSVEASVRTCGTK